MHPAMLASPPTLLPAAPQDFDDVTALLAASGLPYEDLTPAHLAHFHTVRQDGRLLGVVGLEAYGESGLLRSLAVREEARGEGLGDRLVAALERAAVEVGLSTLYLLTTTAAPFFASRGYTTVDRSAVPEAIRQSAEFASICPASAACMVKPLAPLG
jgi:amino-acid N-acetyltransferase